MSPGITLFAHVGKIASTCTLAKHVENSWRFVLVQLLSLRMLRL